MPTSADAQSPKPFRENYALGGGALSAVHFGMRSNPLKLVMLHANGFNAMSYRQVLQPLGIHALALDLRGHGLSTLAADPEALSTWRTFRDDIIEFFDRYIDSPVVVAGHSFGAVTGILAAQSLGKKMSGYVGFDPVIVPQPYRAIAASPWGRKMMKKRLPIAAKAGRRRTEFDSPQQAFENYQGRGIFKQMSDSIIKDYLDGGLIKSGAGVHLACDPLWEQAVFCAQNHNAVKASRDLPAASTIIFAGKNSPTPFSMQARLKARLGRKNVRSSSKLGHLFPLQQPGLATQTLADMLKTVSFSKH